MKTSRSTQIVRTLILLAVAGCGGGDQGPVTPSDPPVPTAISIQPGSATLTYITQTTPFSANVRDQYGASMALTVTWSSADETVFTVDSNGTVTATGNGTATLQASTGALSATADVTVQQTAATIAFVSGNDQQALRNEPLPEPLVVQVEDRGGYGVEGLSVAFRPGAESGSASPDTVVTDAEGVASTVWTLGGKFGAQTMAVWAPGGIQNIASARATSDNPLPDLSVRRFLVSRLDPTSLETIEVDAVIANEGDGPSPDSFAVSLMLDGASLETIHMAQLQPEDTANVTFTAGPFEAGSRTLVLQLDPGEEIDEWEEANNLLEAALNVARQEVIAPGHTSMVSGTLDEVLFFRIDVESPSDEALNVEVSGGQGDPDLFVTFGDRPDNHYKYRCFSGEQPGDAERCQLLPTRRGSYHVAIHAYSAFGPVELKVTVGGTPVEPFNIELVFIERGTAAQDKVFEDAADRWEQVIVRDVWDFDFSFNPQEAGRCGRGSPALNDVVDDVRMFVRIDSIDGPGGILGRAGPCFSRVVPFTGAQHLPGLVIAGAMEFDEDDLNRLEALGILSATITHEMAHVLGFGTLWENFELVHNLAQDNPGADTYFSGPLARVAFDNRGGRSYRGGVKIPVENSGNQGSTDSHWRESVMGNELMTPFLSANLEPLSLVTIESMADLGYEVDPRVADNYRVTGGVAPDQGPVVYLGDDILRMPIRVMGRDGRVLRVIPPLR